METVVSGIRSTGKLHLGNYYGALSNFVKMQNEYNCFFFIADLHSLTTHPTPHGLQGTVRQVIVEYLAAGIDPEKSTIYVQSDVPEVAELYLYMNMNAYLGELERATAFKDKVRSSPDNVNAGLLTYPVLMASDILIHHGTKVPVGKDQEQHLEMTRTFGNRFNRLYNVDYFKEAFAFSYADKLVKVPGLSGQGKMGKSNGEADCIYLSDSETVIRKKVMRAVSDSGPTEMNQPKPEAIQNLFDLMKVVSTADTLQHFDELYNKCEIRYGDFKKQLAEDMVLATNDVRSRIEDISNDDAYIAKVAKMGAEKASESAHKTLKEVREIIGIKRFY
ncbi:tryptophan--tRNA ligase [Sphingobacterium multivorum]|jgi:tryptophanyl-tRNA synthetase|uniref:Tryptophan--tRNA ligase n=3 Tax=Sphingobacterium TaxID=28453 RepID=A0ACD5C5J9_9SPHI|nr:MULTISPECIES: tryptophan--tRNA ligase [Sphingobacterium]QQT32636.1 tryptophan--tRNA ligase [Sphingobacterium multivorum]QQT51446.1 tryptophan--tRNA ligase [Sphingobacterium multivorum]TWI23009.1 tryptophanyl-tRNA synthetase [Sphingobacterium siyangense]UQA77335.1 tryptophan--tRNA ligase [Sphingobacterium siyangense]WON94232.1 tryptophan--tRNA ligase [Sphingobacterium sp. UGAL515B_05]